MLGVQGILFLPRAGTASGSQWPPRDAALGVRGAKASKAVCGGLSLRFHASVALLQIGMRISDASKARTSGWLACHPDGP